jgi:adenylate kinase family enzyme
MDVRAKPALLLLGPTGAGKTPLGRLLEEKGLFGRKCFHFDFGAELRALPAREARASGLEPPDLEAIRRSLATGSLLEDDEFPIALKVLRRFAERAAPGESDLLVLNGLPRHIGQARMMEDIVRVRAVVSLEAAPEVIRERILLDTGGDRIDRPDDEVRAIRQKLVIFRMRTLPLIEYYENREVPVVRITVGARMTAEEMYGAVLGLAKECHFNRAEDEP